MIILGIHGLDPAQAGDVKDVLTAMLRSIGLSAEADVEIYQSEVTSSDGKATTQEYIEVQSNKPKEIQLILETLKKLHINTNVAWSMIGGFIPASDVR